MCLACELDALWYAEWERLGAAGAAVTAGGPPAVVQPADDPAIAGAAAARPPSSSPPAAGAAEMPADPDQPARPPALRSGFFCEEAE
jgi:hypothetical protein